ncbi:hypothetical protein HRbin36_01395 [bacterium HR36]|nr:hypothetical protein HRbin36_01395 [bacterium HR36]
MTVTPQQAAFLADAILLLHFVLVAFVVAGLVFVLVGGLLRWAWVRHFWFRAVHLALVVVIVLESVFGIVCPLTSWEKQLRQFAGEAGAVELERQGFIIYYARKLLFFPDALEWEARTLTWVYLGFGALVAISLLAVPPRWPRRRSTTVAVERREGVTPDGNR